MLSGGMLNKRGVCWEGGVLQGVVSLKDSALVGSCFVGLCISCLPTARFTACRSEGLRAVQCTSTSSRRTSKEDGWVSRLFGLFTTPLIPLPPVYYFCEQSKVSTHVVFPAFEM